MKNKPRLLRITTVPVSLKILLAGQLVFMQDKGFEVLTVSAGGNEKESLTSAGIPHKVVSMTRKITPLQDLFSLFRLIGIMLKFQPDIVHTHTPKAGLLGMSAAWLCRVPVRMHTVAGLPLTEATGFKQKMLFVTESLTYWCASKVLPNSVGLRKFIKDHFNVDKKMTIIGAGSSNGIDSEFFRRTDDLEIQARKIRTRYGINENDIVYIFVGRIVRDKGIAELTEAYKTVLEKSTSNDRVFLMLVGSLEQELDPIKKDDYDFLHQHSQVILAGFQQDVRPWILASDIFVFPSYREGFPNVVMQASCMEIPSIVSDINGCNEIIQQDDTGIIVPVKNAVKLTDAMLLLKEDKMKRKLYGERSRRFVAKHFDQHYVWNELLKEYRKSLE
jgi:glycosyltransferase involved in cell wall biosynthesis